jgi:fatty acid desaturase
MMYTLPPEDGRAIAELARQGTRKALRITALRLALGALAGILAMWFSTTWWMVAIAGVLTVAAIAVGVSRILRLLNELKPYG